MTTARRTGVSHSFTPSFRFQNAAMRQASEQYFFVERSAVMGFWQ